MVLEIETNLNPSNFKYNLTTNIMLFKKILHIWKYFLIIFTLIYEKIENDKFIILQHYETA